MERETLGWRQFLGSVNLRDFTRMVWAELGLIGLSLRVAFDSADRLPFGPLIFGATLLLALVRLVLLTLVVLFFGGTILTISIARRATKASGD